MPAMNTGRTKQARSSCARKQRGFSLLELMVGITVLAVLLGLAVPMFRQVIRNNRIVAQNNDFITALSMARSEAIKRSNAVTVCPSVDGLACSGVTDWTTGWITFADANSNGSLDGAEIVLQQTGSMVPGMAIASPTFTSIRYTATGMLNGAAGTFLLRRNDCVSTTGTEARQIAVAVTGRVSTTRVNCS